MSFQPLQTAESWVQGWGIFWLTLALVILAGFASVASWRAAKAAEKATSHAKLAAEAAMAEVTVARAQLDVSFFVIPFLGTMDESLELFGFWLYNEGAALNIGKVQLGGVVVRHSDDMLNTLLLSDPAYGDGEFEPAGGARWVHRGERLFYRVEPPFRVGSSDLAFPDQVAGLEVLVEYWLSTAEEHRTIWLDPVASENYSKARGQQREGSSNTETK